MAHAVTLEWNEQLFAYCQGMMCRLEAIRKASRNRRSNADQGDMEAIVIHLDASGAEVAVSKFLNRFWRMGVNSYRGPDVGMHIEVKHTPRPDWALLIPKKNADPDRFYVLVRGTMPDYSIVGWIRGKDAMQEKWIRNPNDDGPCYIVPEEFLNDDFQQVKKGEANGKDTGAVQV
jgi:hypothetical protein